MLSSMIEVTVVYSFGFLSCSFPLFFSSSASLHQFLHCKYRSQVRSHAYTTRLLSGIVEKTNTQNNHSTCQWRHMLIPVPTAHIKPSNEFFVRIWIYRKAKRVNANARRIYEVSSMWLRWTIIRPFHLCACVCVSIYAFLICRWLKRKSPVAHKLRTQHMHSWVYIREWHAKNQNNSKCARHTLGMQRYFPRKKCHHHSSIIL